MARQIWNLTMKIVLKIFIIMTLAWIILTPGTSLSQSVKVTGTWSETIDNTDLVGGAGTDLISTYESAANACDIDITGAAKKNWRVDINKVDTLWHTNLHLYVRRTADGTGGGTISGGTTYQEITDVSQTFFSGYDNLRNITIQHQLTGVSVQVGPNTYSTEIYYTIVSL